MTPLKRARSAADTIPDASVPDESGVQSVSISPADRKRIQNLFGGRFLESYKYELVSHQRNRLLPNTLELTLGVSPFPTPLQVVRSFSANELVDATKLLNPALLLYPSTKTRSDLVNMLSPTALKDDKRVAILDPEIVDPDPECLYRSYIVDGSPEMDAFSGDVRMFPYLMRRDRFRNLHALSSCGMTADLYALLSQQSAARGEPIDQQTCTFLENEDQMVIPEYDGLNLAYKGHHASVFFRDKVPPLTETPYVPIGRSLEGRASIEWLNELKCMSEFDLARGRFRRVLGGNLVPRQR